jgi:hypothetical protein
MKYFLNRKMTWLMSDKSIFDPEKLSILDFKFVKGQVETPEDFDVTKIEGHHLENSLLLATDMSQNLIKADFNIEIKTDSQGQNIEEATGSFHLVFVYKVDNLEELANWENPNILELNPVLGNALASITYSTARGIMLTRLQGTAFMDFILPIINPNKLLHHKK